MLRATIDSLPIRSARRIALMAACAAALLCAWLPCSASPHAPYAGANANGTNADRRTPNGTMHPAVCRIVSPDRDGVSFGSGTLIDVCGEYGLVVTNWHVVRDAADHVVAVFPGGFRSAAQIVKLDRDWDLAALVIWRPPGVEPIRLAATAPRPGDALTIIGYGSGRYRAATGRCTQYVAPGANFPFEMVEVSVQARQGDSGGPMLNDKGQLAGVLFGAGRGTTSGSYVGRVQWFLEPVSQRLAQVQHNPTTIAARATNDGHGVLDSSNTLDISNERPQHTSAVRIPGGDANPVEKSPVLVHVPQPRAFEEPQVESEFAANSSFDSDVEQQPEAELEWPIAPAQVAVAPVTPAPSAAPAEIQVINWSAIAGNTWLDKFKTVLAVIGLFALLAQALRWMK